ncbi:hypothetical protein ACTXT7_011902 [Hymenolepis weldensis]
MSMLMPIIIVIQYVQRYMTSDWRDKNDFYVSHWTFYPSSYTDKSALNRASSDNSNELIRHTMIISI